MLIGSAGRQMCQKCSDQTFITKIVRGFYSSRPSLYKGIKEFCATLPKEFSIYIPVRTAIQLSQVKKAIKLIVTNYSLHNIRRAHIKTTKKLFKVIDTYIVRELKHIWLKCVSIQQ